MSKREINDFALKNNISLTEKELDIIYKCVKDNWETLIYSNHYLVLDKYKDLLSENTYKKIEELIPLYKTKYKNYIN